MSIKAVKSLIKNVHTTSSDVVNFNFRSPAEVKLYLDSVRKSIKRIEEVLDKDEKLFTEASTQIRELAVKVVTIDRYSKVPKIQNIKNVDIKGPHVEILKIPKVENLKKNFNVVNQLHDKLETLESLELQLNTMLKDVKGRQQATKYIKSMKQASLKAMQKALSFLSTIAKKHEPELFKEVVNAIVKNLLERIEGTRLKKSAEALYCTITEENEANTFWFTKYLGLQGFVDDSGFVYDSYYIVFTAKIDPAANMSFFVNTFTKFKAPGTFSPGHPFDDPRSGGHAVDSLLAGENFASIVRRMPMPIKKEDLKPQDFKLKGLIKAVEVTEDHSILVTFTQNVTQKNLEDTIVKVFAQLRSTLAPKSRGQLKYKLTKNGTNLAAEFMYLLPSPDSIDAMELSIQQIKLLQKRLGLSDKQVQDIINLLHR